MHFHPSTDISVTDKSRSASGDDIAEHRTATVGPAPPTPLQRALAYNRTAVVTATVAGHFAYYQYLVRFRRLDLTASTNRGFLATAGLAWGCIYIGVLSSITVAQRAIARQDDHLHLN